MLFLISDMFSRLMTSVKNTFYLSIILNSSYCVCILALIYDLGYIRGYNILDKKHIKVFLKYLFGKNGLRSIYIISRPSRRMYIGYKQFRTATINNYIFLNGFIVCSTSYGLLTDIELISYRIGGELAFVVC